MPASVSTCPTTSPITVTNVFIYICLLLYNFVCHYILELSDDPIEKPPKHIHRSQYIDRETSYMGERASKCMDHNTGSLRKGSRRPNKAKKGKKFFWEKSWDPVLARIQGPCQNMDGQLSDRHVGGGIELNFLNNQSSSGYFCHSNFVFFSRHHKFLRRLKKRDQRRYLNPFCLIFVNFSRLRLFPFQRTGNGG